MRKAACRYDLLDQLDDVEESLDRVSRIDESIMNAVRSMKHPLTLEQRTTCYRHVLIGATHSESLILETVLDLLNTGSVTPQCGPVALDVSVSHDCKTIEFAVADGTLTVTDASLMWDCNCHDPYPAGYRRAPCPIHSKPLGESVTRAFNNGLVRITYDGISVFWRQKKDLWPPSIDAFHMVRNLDSDGYAKIPARTVCDVGCGTGFLGLWACNKNVSHKHVTFSDWLLSPLFVTYTNFSYFPHTLTLTPHYMLGLHDNWISKPPFGFRRLFDIVLCNPPYLPSIPGFEDVLYDSTVAGTDLLEYVIEHAATLGRTVYVNFSSIAQKEVNAVLRRTGHSLRRVGQAKIVPFRVRHAFDKVGYTHALAEDGRVIFRPDDIHPYWHSVSTYQVVAGRCGEQAD
ncbi:hypothetical protein J7M28_05635 [bacterium]|nr:hypothetical protein [bacterium]